MLVYYILIEGIPLPTRVVREPIQEPVFCERGKQVRC